MSTRRDFIASTAAGLGLGAAVGSSAVAQGVRDPLYRISLAQWSLNQRIFDGRLDPLDFPVFAMRNFGIDAVEYVNQFFMDKAADMSFLSELRRRCDDSGVSNLLIMCDREGNLGDPDGGRRTEAVENHYKWVEAAQYLGCHSIRVNAASSGTYDDQIDLAADGLRRLSEFAADYGLNVIVENHGGLSSNGAWLSETIRRVGMVNCGTLPDFGNFRISGDEEYDRYLGVTELMPFAHGVSAKSYGFDDEGNEIRTDFRRMMSIVRDAGYRGYVGVEWEGMGLEDVEGIRLTKALLERVRVELSDA